MSERRIICKECSGWGEWIEAETMRLRCCPLCKGSGDARAALSQKAERKP